MDLLSYRTLGAEAPLSRRMPERVLQFGDGNFLRGFVDDFIDQMNEKADFDSSVVIVPPASTGKTGRINRQDGLYQLYLRESSTVRWSTSGGSSGASVVRWTCSLNGRSCWILYAATSYGL